MITDRKAIFRKTALDRLASPEQLDSLIQITDRRGWLALAVLTVLVLAVLAWSIFGHFRVQVRGEAMVMRGGHLFKVSPSRPAHVAELMVDSGMVVTQGQVVAKFLQPELTEKVELAATALKERRQQQVELRVLDEKTSAAELQLLESLRQKPNLNSLDLKEINAREMTLTLEKKKRELTSKFGIDELEQNLAKLEKQLRESEVLKSPFKGRVLEVMSKPGDFLATGEPALSMEHLEKDLQAVVFVKAEEAKKVRPGMLIQIVPSSLSKLEGGSLSGKIRFVADYPATKTGIMSILENDQLVQRVLAIGSPTILYADLLPATRPSPAPASDPKKDQAPGPHAGTVCSASIVVSDRPPITYMFPALTQWFGL